MKYCKLFLLFFAHILFLSINGEETLPRKWLLVDKNNPKAVIVIARKATKAARLAAYELQEHIKMITGATLPIVDDEAKSDGIRLVVGDSKVAREIGAPTNFEDEEYALLFKPDSIVMIGNDEKDYGDLNYRNPIYPNFYDIWTWPDYLEQKGTLYAVYDFLEKVCDVRWFNQSEFGTDAPERKTLEVAGESYRRKPAFLYRSPQGRLKENMELYDRGTSRWTVGWSWPTPKYEEWLKMIYEKGKKLPEVSHPHRWLAYQRGQVYAFFLRNKLGGIPYKVNHSLEGWYNRFWEKDSKYSNVFEGKRPDYFAKGYPEAKKPPQLCFSNPAVDEQILKDMEVFYSLPSEERKKQRLGTDRFYPIVPMDNGGWCKCRRCMALVDSGKKETSFSNGKHSRLVWTFIDRVARKVKQKFPDKTIATLAYSGYARKPENMKIADNISVQMCLFPHYVAANPKGLLQDDEILKEWGDGRPLFLWLYTSWTTTHKPQVPWFPRLMGHEWAPLLRKYQKAGVQGLFLDGVANESDMYFLFKLADDPQRDDGKLIEEYFNRMYGVEAGKYLLEFYNIVEQIYQDPRNHPEKAKGPELYWGVQGTAKRMEALAKLFDQAAREVQAHGSDIQKKRFAILKYDMWDYMREGREKYVGSKVVKADKPIGIICPMMNKEANGDLDNVDWSDSQFFSGWNKDDGDMSLRKIFSHLICDEHYLYMRLVEDELVESPKTGDTWELLITDQAGDKRYSLFVDMTGRIKGKVDTNGAPQDWDAAGFKAIPQVAGKRWETRIALPINQLPLDKDGRLHINIRRNDASLEDSPVWLATGNAFETGKLGARVAFDKRLGKPETVDFRKSLIAEWNFQSAEEKVVKDSSNHGNDGRIIGAIQKVKEDGVPSIKITGGNQCVELDHLKGMKDNSFTFSCWGRFADDHQGTLRILTVGTCRIMIVLPHKRLIVYEGSPQGQTRGIGPMGVELEEKKWHMFTFSYDGKILRIYENGRQRGNVDMRGGGNFQYNMPWLIGGEPKLQPWYTFIGEISRVEIFNRILSDTEIISLYLKEMNIFRR